MNCICTSWRIWFYRKNQIHGFPEQMFTSISQNLFVPHSSHWSRKFSGRLQPSRSFYQHKLNFKLMLILPYPPTIIFSAGSEDLRFRSKRCFKKEKAVLQVLQICGSLFFYFLCFLQFYCTWNSQSSSKLCKIPDFVLANRQGGEPELYLVSVAGDGHGLPHVDRVTKACIHYRNDDYHI